MNSCQRLPGGADFFNGFLPDLDPRDAEGCDGSGALVKNQPVPSLPFDADDFRKRDSGQFTGIPTAGAAKENDRIPGDEEMAADGPPAEAERGYPP
jgi:hypothetical protein